MDKRGNTLLLALIVRAAAGSRHDHHDGTMAKTKIRSSSPEDLRSWGPGDLGTLSSATAWQSKMNDFTGTCQIKHTQPMHSDSKSSSQGASAKSAKLKLGCWGPGDLGT